MMAQNGTLHLLCGLLVIALLCLVAGCGDDGSPKDTIAPTVVDTSPADGATDVSPYPIVDVWFSEAMDPATIDTLTLFIEGLRAHSITYDAAAHKATLYPVTAAEAGTEYDVHVEAEVEDAAGNAMDESVVVSFTTGARDCAHLADRFEPNDVIASATPVLTDVVYPGLTSCGGVERTDHYRFTLSETRKVTVKTVSAWVDTDYVSWKIHFRRENGDYLATLGTGVYGADDENSYYHTFLPGTYWVGIGNANEVSHIVLYNLTVVTSEPAEEDGYEDNDFPDQAKPLAPGRHEGLRGTYVDPDWFSIDLAEGQTLTVTATEVTSTGTTRRLWIANATGVTYTGHTDTVNPAVESWTAEVTGKYLIKVRWWDDGVVYNLDLDVTP